MLDYDTHLHELHGWPAELKGGVVLSIDDGGPPVLGAKKNQELEALKLPDTFLKAFHVSSDNVFLPDRTAALYFHPRRNNINCSFVKKK